MNKRQRKKRMHGLRGQIYLAFWIVARQHHAYCDAIRMIRRRDDKWCLHPVFYAIHQDEQIAVAHVHVGHHRVNGRIQWLEKNA